MLVTSSFGGAETSLVCVAPMPVLAVNVGAIDRILKDGLTRVRINHSHITLVEL